MARTENSNDSYLRRQRVPAPANGDENQSKDPSLAVRFYDIALLGLDL